MFCPDPTFWSLPHPFWVACSRSRQRVLAAGGRQLVASGQHGGETTEWSHSVEHILYPAIKKLLLPPASCMTDRTLVQVANLPDLYKVFERC